MSETEMTDEVENQEDDSIVVDESTEEEETSSNEEDITYEQARAWKQSLDKANKKIAHLTKDKKAIEKPVESKKTVALDDDSLDELLERRDFYKKNADAKALKDDIEALYKTSKGKFSREDIYGKLSGDSEIDENRKVYAKSSVSGKQSSNDSFVAVDIDKYDSMSPAQQKAYNTASKEKFGGVKFKE